MNKIRILIAHDNETYIKKFENVVKDIDYVQIVGITEDGQETYNKIVNLRPEMVFDKFDLDKLDGLEIIKKSKEKLNEATPIFNVITDRKLENTLKEIIEVAGDNLNSIIEEQEPLDSRLKSIFKEYQSYK